MPLFNFNQNEKKDKRKIVGATLIGTGTIGTGATLYKTISNINKNKIKYLSPYLLQNEVDQVKQIILPETKKGI